MIPWPQVQARLGVKPDGSPGRVTYAALLHEVAGRAVPLANDLGLALALNATAYAIDANPERLSSFLGQTCHESAGFVLLHEIWGPTPAQQRYEGSTGLGNTQPGDGYRFRGRGLIQLTGRANYADFGRRIGLDLVSHPELAEQPTAAVMTALEFWRVRNLNVMADIGDDAGITRKINGGSTGLPQRIALTAHARALLS